MRNQKKKKLLKGRSFGVSSRKFPIFRSSINKRGGSKSKNMQKEARGKLKKQKMSLGGVRRGHAEKTVLGEERITKIAQIQCGVRRG